MTRAQANFLLLIAAFLWGSGNVAQKTVLDDIGPVTAVGFRCLIATLFLAPFFGRFEAWPNKEWVKSALPVIATFLMAVTLYQISAGLTTVTNTGFLVNISIVVTPIVGWVILRQRPHNMVWPAAIFALSGAYMMAGGFASQLNLGDVLAILAAIVYSFWMIFLGQFVVTHGQAGLITLAQFLVAGVVCLFFGFMFEPFSMAAFYRALPELLMLGIASTGLGYLLQAIAQAHTSPSEAAVIVSGEAIFGALFAFMLLGETLNSAGLIGAFLILGGIVLIQLNPPPKFAAPRIEGGKL